MFRNKTMTKVSFSVLAAAAVTVIGLSSPAHATKTIELTAIDGYPTKASWVNRFQKFYIPNIDKALAKTGNYKIKWNQAWGGQIVKPKHVLEGLQKGLGDIGVVTTVFHPDKVPMQGVAYNTPFVSTDGGLISKTVDDMANKFPKMKGAWRKYNQHYLTNLVVLDTYNMFTRKKISSPSDLKGLKIAGAGANLKWLKGLGAVGVGGSLVGYYNKLKTGVVDGAIVWVEAAAGKFKLVQVAPYMLDARMGAVNSKAITVNSKTWAKLPAEVQKVLQDEGIKYRVHMAGFAMKKAAKMKKVFVKKKGTIVPVSEDARMAWAKGMPSVGKQWAASLDKKGLPGTAALKFYMDAMRAGNQPILRHWDK